MQNADGMMDRVGAANFIDSCCHDRCKPTDERVNKFFRYSKSRSVCALLTWPIAVYLHGLIVHVKACFDRDHRFEP